MQPHVKERREEIKAKKDILVIVLADGCRINPFVVQPISQASGTL
jgi:hypothetical protein